MIYCGLFSYLCFFAGGYALDGRGVGGYFFFPFHRQYGFSLLYVDIHTYMRVLNVSTLCLSFGKGATFHPPIRPSAFTQRLSGWGQVVIVIKTLPVEKVCVQLLPS